MLDQEISKFQKLIKRKAIVSLVDKKIIIKWITFLVLVTILYNQQLKLMVSKFYLG